MPHAIRVDQRGVQADGIVDEMNAFREFKYLNVFFRLPDIGFDLAFESAILNGHVRLWICYFDFVLNSASKSFHKPSRSFGSNLIFHFTRDKTFFVLSN
jgi:hypothetical protein